MPRMATFVHLTPAANSGTIRRAGVGARSPRQVDGDPRRGVYLFPVMTDHVDTYQWSREMRRTHGRGRVVAVQVRVPDAERVLVGRFDGQSGWTTAADAVGVISGLTDRRGWEVFLPRAIAPAEIQHVREVRPVGWRYFPGSHGSAPCTCNGCRDRGGFGSRRLLERRPDSVDGPRPGMPALLERLDVVDLMDREAVIALLDDFGDRRRGPVDRLAHLVEHPDPEVRAALAWTIGGWSTPGAHRLLERLAGDLDAEVREAAEAWTEESR